MGSSPNNLVTGLLVKRLHKTVHLVLYLRSTGFLHIIETAVFRLFYLDPLPETSKLFFVKHSLNGRLFFPCTFVYCFSIPHFIRHNIE